MCTGIEIIGIISAIATIATSVMGLLDSTAGKEADLRKQQLDALAQDRELEKQRNEARLQREARAKRAAVINNAGSKGAGSSSAAQGAVLGISSAQGREQSYLDQKAALAAQSDSVTRSQIELDASNARSNEITQSVNGIVSGSTDLLGNPIFTDLFSSNDLPQGF